MSDPLHTPTWPETLHSLSFRERVQFGIGVWICALLPYALAVAFQDPPNEMAAAVEQIGLLWTYAIVAAATYVVLQGPLNALLGRSTVWRTIDAALTYLVVAIVVITLAAYIGIVIARILMWLTDLFD